jgi:predicted methyltransferase
MVTEDLARQAKLVAPLFSDKRVAFVGDMDGTASLLGLIATSGRYVPKELLILDFDERVLESARVLAKTHGYSELVNVRLYNCFDPVPSDLLGTADWFYTNPPYGSHNLGASGRLFITRGCELVGSQRGSGCVILPNDTNRPWTCDAMIATQHFLESHGWEISDKVENLHRYHLDDDPDLTSALIVVDQTELKLGGPMPFAGRQVRTSEIPDFYGRSTLPPYPRSIDSDGRQSGAMAA